jgi:hypothetical protein
VRGVRSAILLAAAQRMAAAASAPTGRNWGRGIANWVRCIPSAPFSRDGTDGFFPWPRRSFTTTCQKNLQKKPGRYIDAAAFRPWSVPLLWPRSHALPQSYLINRLSERLPQKGTPSSLHTWGVGVCCLTLGIWAGQRRRGWGCSKTQQHFQ